MSSFLRGFGFVVVAGALAGVGCGSVNGGPAPSADGGVGDGGARADGCPASMPSPNGPCKSEGKTCGYDCDDGGPGSARCEGGKWSVAITDQVCEVDAGGPPPADAPFACGTQTCGTTQYCVEPCCGGAGPRCEPNDGGACPSGTHPATCGGGLQGCEDDPCVPPPPFCVDSATDPKAAGCSNFDKSKRSLTCQCA